MDCDEICVSAAEAGRDILDVVSGRIIRESKTRLRRLIAGGAIRVDGRAVTPAARVHEGQTVSLPAGLDRRPAPRECLVIDILHEDAEHLVVSKPTGYPVLPARRGGREFYDSLVGLLNRGLPPGTPWVRPHIVHRLDRETSGVLLVAKNEAASRSLSAQFQHRRVRKRYLAIIEGVLPRPEVTIQVPLARSRTSVLKMAADAKAGKPASTRVVLKRAFGHFSLVEAIPLSGRQHQIRVHLSAIGYPLAVDFLYGRREVLRGREFNEIVGARRAPPGRMLLARCPLHSASIEYDHPTSGERLSAHAPIPADMAAVLEFLSAHDPPKRDG